MKQSEWKNNKQSDAASHGVNSQFSEWPTPADVVKGFGGNPEKVDDKQWKMKKNSPGSK